MLSFFRDDHEWLPYKDTGKPGSLSIWDDIAYSVKVSDLPGWLANRLPSIQRDGQRYKFMRERAAELMDSFFTYDAVMRHIWSFFENPTTSALKCVPRQTAF